MLFLVDDFLYDCFPVFHVFQLVLGPVVVWNRVRVKCQGKPESIGKKLGAPAQDTP